MKLETKLGVNTGVLILAMFISAFVAGMRLESVGRLASRMGNQRRPFVIAVETLRIDLANTVIAVQSSILSPPRPAAEITSQNQLLDLQKTIDSTIASLKELDGGLDLGPDEGRLAGIYRQVHEIEDQEQKAEAQLSLGTPEATAQARAILQQRLLPPSAFVNDALTEMVSTQNGIVTQELGELQAANRAVLLTLWIATLFGALAGGVISFLLARRIILAIDLVARRAGAIASGDLSGSALDINSSDQVGRLAHAMQQMQASLGNIIGTVAQTSRSLATSAASMNSATDRIHHRVDQQTQQAATAMQEMSASIAEVSRHAQSAAETSRSAAETARQGDAIVKEMLSSMHSIATAVSDTSSTLGLLGEDSRRISQIVTVIDEIATKTNLLALNAAIEAARAGEHGRGFAVVAGEVRRLAESTAQATSEIASMIQGIQTRTRAAVASMASGTLTVQQGVATTNRAGQALESILNIAERVDRMIAQIAIAASQQAAAADRSSSSLDSIHILSYENLSEMATTSTGIESLRSIAAALASQVERFRLNDAQPQAAPGQHPNPLRPISRSINRPKTNAQAIA